MTELGTQPLIRDRATLSPFLALAGGYWYRRRNGPLAFLAADSNRQRLPPAWAARRRAFVKSGSIE